MKTYEKPILVALAVSGNDHLCAACPVDGSGSNMDPLLANYLDLYKLNITQLFDNSEICEVPVDDYCKHTSAKVVFDS